MGVDSETHGNVVPSEGLGHALGKMNADTLPARIVVQTTGFEEDEEAPRATLADVSHGGEGTREGWVEARICADEAEEVSFVCHVLDEWGAPWFYPIPMGGFDDCEATLSVGSDGCATLSDTRVPMPQGATILVYPWD